MSHVEENTNVVGYVGTRISKRTYKRFLATARTNEERRAIKYLYLSAPLKYEPATKKAVDRATEISDAIKNSEAVRLRS